MVAPVDRPEQRNGELNPAARFLVEVDESICVCSLNCATTVPAVFEAEGYELKVVCATPPAELSAALLEAERMCPTGAITLTEVQE